MDTYTIKPLKWEHTKTDDCDTWEAHTIFCTLRVTRNTWATDGESWSPWRFEYCIAEYYNEHREEVDSATDGKRKAEKWYLQGLMPALNKEPPR